MKRSIRCASSLKLKSLSILRWLPLAMLLWWVSLPALEPPRPDQIRQYKEDGTMGERVEAARALGNHRVSPKLALGAKARLAKLVSGVEAEDSFEPPAWWQGGLPAFGNPKVLTLLIAFSDTPPVTGDTQPLITSKLYGDGATMPPYDSLRNFYRRSSYNQLDIGGSALGWYTTAYPRSSVVQSDSGRQNLIKEALNYYNAQGHDFSQYDNDGDGTIDYFAVVWTGQHGAWASFWWGYQTYFGDSSYSVDGKRLGAYSWQWESYNYPSGLFEPSTIIHETGHALGLPDYYDYDDSVGPDGGVGGLDQMDWYGDHNCFSKFLLEWITPTVCNAEGAHQVSLNPSESSKDALIVMPDAVPGEAFDEYFMIQVRNQTENDMEYPNSGLLIWHVDAHLDPATGYGDYLYNNSYTAHKLLRLMEADGLEEIERNYNADAGDYYTQGRSLGNATVPNSKRYDGISTGIAVDSISAYGSPMSFQLTCSAPTCSLTCTATVPATGSAGGNLSFQSSAVFIPSGCGTATYAWDFDNNGTTDSTLQNPSHSYSSSGTFTWKLTVTGSNGAGSCIKSGTIAISGTCTLSCSAEVPSTGAIGAPIGFGATATFSPAGCGTPIFDWNFGDGSPHSNQEDPSHTYASGGTYDWVLTVNGTNGVATCTRQGSITISTCTAPSCASNPSPAAGASGVSTSPTLSWNASPGATSYDIYFGTTADPPYATNRLVTSYSPGQLLQGATYYWRVVPSGPCGGATGCPVWSFTTVSACSISCNPFAMPSSGTAPLSVNFSANLAASNCTGQPSFSWNFGDGAASAQRDPSHTYASPGVYIWSLTASLSGQTCTAGGAITVGAQPECHLTGTASAIPSVGPAPLDVSFSATLTSSDCTGTAYFLWRFGDGGASSVQNPHHTYSQPGLYTWTLSAGIGDKSVSISGQVSVSPPCSLSCVASASPSGGLVPLEVAFASSASLTNCQGTPVFSWEFGDGSTSSEQNPLHIYQSAGIYQWVLSVAAGGESCTQNGTVTVAEPCSLTCLASASTDSGVSPLHVDFTATATASNCGGAPSFTWAFGDGQTSIVQNPSHIYQDPGTYSWTLAVTAGDKSCTRGGTVTVSPPCTLSCSASASPASGTIPLQVSFTATATPSNCPGAVSYNWSFGDGGTSLEQSPAHSYQQAGNYTWVLTVLAGGVTCTQTGQVTANEPCTLACTATAQPVTGPQPLSVQFGASATPSHCAGIPAFSWTFGDGATSSEQNPSHTYQAADTYTWTLAVSIEDVTCTRSGEIVVSRPLTPGDCNSDGTVSIGDVQKSINMFLGIIPPECGADCSGDGTVSIGELQKVINNFLGLSSTC